MQDRRKFAFAIIGVDSIAQEEFLEMRFYLPSSLVVRLHARYFDGVITPEAVGLGGV